MMGGGKDSCQSKVEVKLSTNGSSQLHKLQLQIEELEKQNQELVNEMESMSNRK